ncbi:MAG: LPS export ABC transporter permease LptF [Burkholderiaceae bacterium]|nr:LPS export ABC transporter permease LptF [Burkholderiaceae bacterium]
MIFHKALLQELRAMAGVVFASLLTVVVTTTLIRTLGRAASGKADGELVLPLIALSTVNALGLVISLTAFISVLMVLSRLWRDSEMVVWLSCGESLMGLVRPVWRFLWPLALTVAAISLVASPWARQQSEVLRQQFESREDSGRIAPGQFRESNHGTRTFFVENPSEESTELGTVFVVTREANGQESVLLAARGQFESDASGEPWVFIQDGTRTDLQPHPASDGLSIRSMSFEGYRLRADAAPGGSIVDPSIRALPIHVLLGVSGPQPLGEISYRVGLPLLCLLLGLLAIPLSFSNPRAGRSFHLLFALLITMVANNLLAVSQAWIAQERVSFALGWWPLHVMLLAMLLAMFWFRMGLRRSPIDMLWGWARAVRSRPTSP